MRLKKDRPYIVQLTKDTYYSWLRASKGVPRNKASWLTAEEAVEVCKFMQSRFKLSPKVLKRESKG
jgi:hypothetical protein